MEHKSSGHVASVCGMKRCAYTEELHKTTEQGELNATVESFFHTGAALPVYFHQFCLSFWITRELAQIGK